MAEPTTPPSLADAVRQGLERQAARPKPPNPLPAYVAYELASWNGFKDTLSKETRDAYEG